MQIDPLALSLSISIRHAQKHLREGKTELATVILKDAEEMAERAVLRAQARATEEKRA